MRRYVHTILLVALASILTLPVVMAQDAEPVRERLNLPLSGPLDLSPFIAESEGALRVVVSGTFDRDGFEYDGFAKFRGDERVEERQVLVMPEGAEVLESDPEIHRYVVSIPRSAAMELRINPRAMSEAGAFETPSEVLRSARGAIEVSVLGPPIVVSAGATVVDDPMSMAEMVGIGAAIGLPLFGLVAFGLRRRQRDVKPELELARRARTARSAVARESARLGPAFREVDLTAGKLMSRADALCAHVVDARAALKRTAAMRSEGADEERQRLQKEYDDDLSAVSSIADRLEAVAVRLASQVAGETRVSDADEVAATLGEELALAEEAEEEARALFAS